MSFTKKKIDLTFQLGTGNFGEGGFNTVEVTGLRVQASITATNGPVMGNAQLRIYGLNQSLMRQLTFLNSSATLQKKNTLIVSAGDDQSGMSIVFQGQIVLGQIDLNNPPESALVVVGNTGYIEAIKPISPSSYPGPADAAIVMGNLAASMGLQFENNGVSGIILNTPYFPGTGLEQARRCAEAANINWIIEDGVRLCIWPMNGSREGVIPLISPSTGMIGYPAYSTGIGGISIKTLYNPFVRIGKQVQIESSLQIANGIWTVFSISHELESETPNGNWITRFECNR